MSSASPSSPPSLGSSLAGEALERYLSEQWMCDAEDHEESDVGSWLLKMSIIPSCPPAMCYRRPVDLPEHLIEGPIYLMPRCEGDEEQRKRESADGARVIDAQKRPDIYSLCTKVIQLIRPKEQPDLYKHLIARKVTILGKGRFKCIWVDVVGPNCNYCLLHGGKHEYRCDICFMIQPLQYKVEARCYAYACKEVYQRRKNIQLYEKKEALRLQKLASAGVDTMDASNTANDDAPLPLSAEQEDALQEMQVEIDVHTFYREPLCEAIDEPYCGPRRPSVLLVPENSLSRRTSSVSALSVEHERKSSAHLLSSRTRSNGAQTMTQSDEKPPQPPRQQ